MNQIRQGDVFLVRDDKAKHTGLKAVKPNGGRLILAEGEATGHHHSVDASVATLFGGKVLVVREPTTLDHQEHAAVEVAPGTYWVVRQRMYAKTVRRVQD
jgi:hypothetical protein